MATKITDEQYRVMAELRYQIRLFLQQAELAARSQGIGSQQYQVLLVIKGLQMEKPCTIRDLSERVLLKHHSTVELLDRLEANHLVARCRDRKDRRKAFVKLQPKGERILEKILRQRLQTLHSSGRRFVETLSQLVGKSTS